MPDIDPTPWSNDLKELMKKVYTNEFWFCRLSTDNKAKFLADLTITFILENIDAENKCEFNKVKEYWKNWLQTKKDFN